MMASIDPAFSLSNHIEAGFWCAIGVGLVIASARHAGIVRRDALRSAAVFVIFGASDWVEAMTGAWWRPWWLLAWKAGCVLALLWLLERYARRRRTVGSASADRLFRSARHKGENNRSAEADPTPHRGLL